MKDVNLSTLRSCKMDSNALAEIVDVVPFLESAVLSYNNFSKSDAPRALAEAILTSDCRIKVRVQTSSLEMNA